MGEQGGEKANAAGGVDFGEGWGGLERCGGVRARTGVVDAGS